MENEFIDNNHKIEVYCWYCGKKFYVDNIGVHAGDLFCSNKCREDNLDKERKEYYENNKSR
jgi:predicted nucleic acid-binding Zn ribbon protein